MNSSPSPTSLEALIGQIHAQEVPLVLAITGGGSGSIGQLLSVPGGSRTLLEAVVPYHLAALTRFLRAAPEQACSELTARRMAMAAYMRAGELLGGVDGEATPKRPRLGLGVTASLASDRPKRGDHRIHLAWQSADTTATVSLTLSKGARSRQEEESLAAALVIQTLAEALGLDAELDLALRNDEQLIGEQVSAPAAWRELLAGERLATLERGTPQENFPSSAEAPVLLPGAFNPLHEGHLQMMAVARRMLSRSVAFEISIENVEKPPLDFHDMSTRAAALVEHGDLWFTRAATFVEKARLFPGATFLVGADTVARIGQPRFYGGDVERARAAIDEIAALDCRFLVFGRAMADRFQTADSLQLDRALREICEAVPENLFRADISSTELRRRSLDG